MKVYHYNKKTGELITFVKNGKQLNYTEARPDPLEKGKFLLPANATFIAPKKGENVFNDGKWNKVPDYRKRIVYDKKTKRICNMLGLGELSDNLTLLVPKARDKWDYNNDKWVTDIQLLGAFKKDLAFTAYSKTIKKGMEFQLSNGDKIIVQCSEDDMQRLVNSDIKDMIRDIDNVNHNVSDNDFDRLITEMKAYIAVLKRKFWQIKDAITGAQTEEKLNKIDIKV